MYNVFESEQRNHLRKMCGVGVGLVGRENREGEQKNSAAWRKRVKPDNNG